jgi:hypothetical protein
MRLPRFRFTVRRMMVVVAIVGTLFGFTAIGIRRSAFLRRAEAHGKAAREQEAIAEYLAIARTYKINAAGTGFILTPDWSGRAKALRSYHDQLQNKYLRAARYPWLPVAPDPHMPE